jgi:hypothetical protein
MEFTKAPEEFAKGACRAISGLLSANNVQKEEAKQWIRDVGRAPAEMPDEDVVVQAQTTMDKFNIEHARGVSDRWKAVDELTEAVGTDSIEASSFLAMDATLSRGIAKQIVKVLAFVGALQFLTLLACGVATVVTGNPIMLIGGFVALFIGVIVSSVSDVWLFNKGFKTCLKTCYANCITEGSDQKTCYKVGGPCNQLGACCGSGLEICRQNCKANGRQDCYALVGPCMPSDFKCPTPAPTPPRRRIVPLTPYPTPSPVRRRRTASPTIHVVHHRPYAEHHTAAPSTPSPSPNEDRRRRSSRRYGQMPWIYGGDDGGGVPIGWDGTIYGDNDGDGIPDGWDGNADGGE